MDLNSVHRVDFVAGIKDKNFNWYLNKPYLEILTSGNNLLQSALVEKFTIWHWAIKLKLNSFLRKNENVKVIYSEINGFYINPFIWNFSFDGYASDGGNNDYEWLCYPCSWSDRYFLSGFPKLNTAYSKFINDNMWKDGKLDAAKDLSDLIVATKFYELMFDVFKNKKSQIKIYIGVHDFDVVMKIE